MILLSVMSVKSFKAVVQQPY